ncbi:phage tail protein [Nonomuraea sp. NPDC052116]|uniref:phage tail protein n=1 Tax=Nonomuraea sp. NPDC052116 TaxID=3155665 RepID=UPI0034466AD1
MDVNGTRFHLLLAEADWAPADGTGLREHGLQWSEGGLTLRSALRRFPPPKGSRDLTPAGRRGAAPDRYGDWFFIGPERTDIRLVPAGEVTSTRYWPREDPAEPPAPGEFQDRTPPGPPSPLTLAGLVVTEHHYLIVGVPAFGGILVFDLHGGGPPVPVLWPDGLDPVDMAPAPGGGAWILDRAPSLPGRARLWLVDRYLRPPGVPVAHHTDFGPVAGAPAPPDAIGPAAPMIVTAADPISVEALPDGTVLVLDRQGPAGPARVIRMRGHEEIPFPLDAGELRGPAHDLAFLPGPGLLVLVDAQGNQAFSYRVTPDEITFTGDYVPIRMFTGKAIVTFGESVYYDMGDRWLPLVARHGNRYEREGTLIPGSFDGGEPGCVWHRLTIDGCLPLGTGLAVESRAADEPGLLAGQPWNDEPAPYLRASGSELAWHRPFPPENAPEGAGTWELLFQRAKGRHLQLRLTLRGNGRSSPRLGALRIHYPRFSYLREYLPDAYQEDEYSASFLDRYLANPEGVNTTVEGLIETAQALFDVRTVPAEFLPWLASWVGGVLDPDWEEARRRLFIRHAVRMFGRTGTSGGLVRAVRLAIDECPDDSLFLRDDDDGGGFSVRVVEDFRTPRSPADVTAADTGPFRAFLRQRYGRPERLNAAWNLSGAHQVTDFDQMELPEGPPEQPDALRDWTQFVAIVLPAARRAHRFTVLVPVRLDENDSALERRLGLVERVVRAERPAHTAYRVKAYWAAFTVGGARVGLETVVSQGSRFAAVVLGRGRLGAGFLTGAAPWEVGDRFVVGRDGVAGKETSGE